jgi:endonuclease G
MDDFRNQPEFDRGHNAPARDFVFSQRAMDGSFALPNMSAQNKMLNETKWNALEKYCQDQIIAHPGSQAWIITIPLYRTVHGPRAGKQTIRMIGENGVWVPLAFSKSLLLLPSGEQSPAKIESWIMPNDPPPADAQLDEYRQSVDLIETLAGLEMWGKLPEPLQGKLEAAK